MGKESEFRSQNSGVAVVQEHQTGRAREDVRRNSRSGASRDKSGLYGGASEAKAELPQALRGIQRDAAKPRGGEA